mgnify:FL=1
MKKLLLPAFFALSILSHGFAQCLCTSQYPAGTVTPTTVWSTINTLMYAGDYAVVNVTAGNTYEFSTCAASGSNVAYDSELTLLSDQQQLLAYNDDFCGNQSQVSWLATYTGTVQIHLTEYYLGSGCWTNSTPSSIRYRYTAGAVTIPANNVCANATALTPSANCNLTNGTTIGASEDPYPDPSCDLPGVYNDVWYTFNSGAFTSLNLTVNLGTAALIGVEFYSACGTLASGLSLGGTPGNCDFNTNAPNPTVITGLTPNTNYRMRLFTNASYDMPGTFTTCLTTPPPPTVSVNSTSICAGQSVTLTATPSIAGGSYLWSNGATTPTITVTPNATTSYSVTYSNNGTASGSGTVTVNPAPSINGGQDQTVCAGTSVTLNGTGGSSYTWNNGISNGVAFVANATTTYTVTGTDANGCTNTDQVTVTVNAAPTVNALNNQTLCAGASASAVTFSGTAGATYAWVNSNPSIGLAGSGSGNIAVFTASNATANPITGTITVTPSQAGCTGTPQTFSYTVNPNPTITGNNPLCVGATLQLTGSGTAAANNAWVSGTPANGTVSNTGLVTGVNGGNTTITYTNINGCIATQAITINANPTANAGQDQTLCAGGNATLTGTANGGSAPYTYSWNNGVQQGVPFPLNATGTYTVTVTDGNGCTSSDNVTLTSTSIDWANLQWPASGTVCLGQTHNVYGQIYVAGITNGPGQAAGITAQVGVNSTNTDPSTWPVNAWSNATFNTQAGNNDEYTAGIGNLLSAGTYYYTFRYSLGQGCPNFYGGFNGGAWNGSSNTNGALTINAAPNATSAVNACESYTWYGQTYTQSGTFTHTVPSGAGCDSVLYLNLTIFNNVSGPTIQQTACDSYTWNGQTYFQSGTYTHLESSQQGCDSTVTLSLTINSAPSNVQVVLNQGTFTVTAQNASTYTWLDCSTNSLIPGENSASYTPTVSGSYAAIVTNSCGSDTSTCEPIEVQGVNEKSEAIISIYPNPSDGIFTVSAKDAHIEYGALYNVNGELLQGKAYHENEITIDLGGYATGSYLFHVISEHQTLIFKLQKQ